jgi:hypothetical protein
MQVTKLLKNSKKDIEKDRIKKSEPSLPWRPKDKLTAATFRS